MLGKDRVEFPAFLNEPHSLSAAVAIDQEEELLTLEEFAELDLGETADLVNGKVELMGNNNPDHSEVLLNLGAILKPFVKKHKLGKVYGGDVTTLVRRGPDT